MEDRGRAARAQPARHGSPLVVDLDLKQCPDHGVERPDGRELLLHDRVQGSTAHEQRRRGDLRGVGRSGLRQFGSRRLWSRMEREP